MSRSRACRRARPVVIRRTAARLVSAGALVAAAVACSDGGGIQQAGDDGQAVEQTASTIARSLADLPPCPVDALADASATGPVEITFWHALTNENARVLQQLTDEYNASQQRVRVDLAAQGGYQETIDKYLQSDTPNRPDLVQMPEYAIQLMIDTASTIPMQACTSAAGYSLDPLLDRAVAAYSTQGVQWAMPFNVSNPVLYYNKRAFAAAGLDPDDPPVSFEELEAASARLRSSGAAAHGIALDSDADAGGGWYVEQWLSKAGQLYADNDNGRAAPATQVLYDGPVGEELLASLQRLVQSGDAIYVGDNPGDSDTLLKLADPDGGAAMAIATSAALGAVLSFVGGGLISGVGPDDIGVGPMPGPDGAPGALVGGNALWIVAGRGEARAAAAWDFVTYLVGAPAQSTMAAGTGYVPVRTDATEIEPLASVYAADPRFSVAVEQVQASTDGPASSGPVLGPMREVRAVTAEAVGAILDGAPVGPTLSGAATSADALIADYARRSS